VVERPAVTNMYNNSWTMSAFHQSRPAKLRALIVEAGLAMTEVAMYHSSSQLPRRPGSGALQNHIVDP
jgi:hypothetical protein